jgi:class 3 adenylate cyclase
MRSRPFLSSIAIAAALLAIMAIAACAGKRVDQAAANSATDPATANEELMALDREWVEAEVKHNRQVLERVLDDGFVATFTSGTTYDKPAYIAAVVNAPITPFEVIHDLVRVHGDTAVVIDRIGTAPGTKVVWVAIRREGRWRVIAEQFIAIAPPPK